MPSHPLDRPAPQPSKCLDALRRRFAIVARNLTDSIDVDLRRMTFGHLDLQHSLRNAQDSPLRSLLGNELRERLHRVEATLAKPIEYAHSLTYWIERRRPRFTMMCPAVERRQIARLP